MKKELKGFLVGVVITSVLMSNLPAIAATVTKTIKVIFNPVKITINGKNLSATNLSYNGTYYVPVKNLSEGLGKVYKFDSKTKVISITDIETPKFPEDKLYTKADLPYTIKGKNDMSVTIHDYSATTEGIKLNITLANNSKTSDKGGIMVSTYQVYDGKNTLMYKDADEIFYDTIELRAGQTITGNINFEGLTHNADSFFVYGSLWQFIDKENFKIKLKVE